MVSVDLLDDEKSFIEWYEKKCPVSTGNSVVNRIAWRIESVFKSFRESKTDSFDYSILKSGVEYDRKTFNRVTRLYKDYIELYSEFRVMVFNHRMDAFNFAIKKSIMNKNFISDCFKICSNEDVLCDILVDCCYEKSLSKHFVWEMCPSVIIENLLRANGNKINYIERDENGSIDYCSMRFAKKYKQLLTNDKNDNSFIECGHGDDFNEDVTLSGCTKEYDQL